MILQEREERKPNSNEIIYFISTVDNYNVHTNITLDVETNLKVLCEVLDFCRDTNTVFNFISSWFVYGETELPAKEEYFCKPTGFYSITKKAAEDLLISFCRTYGVKYRILRLCNVMGSGDGKVSSKKNALSYMIDLLKKDEDVYLYDEGTPIRDIMHVDDVCRAIELVCREGKFNEIYNIGSDPINEKTVMEVAEILINKYYPNDPIENWIEYVDDRNFNDKMYFISSEKLRMLGWKPIINFKLT